MKRLWEALKNPGGAVFGVACAVTAVFVTLATLAVVFEYGGWPAYPAYALAALSLGYAVYAAVRVAPKIKAGVLAAADKRRLTAGFVRDFGVRTLVFSGISFAVNIAYVLFNGALGIINRSVWYGSLAAYYLFLSGLRLGIFQAGRVAGRSKGGDLCARKLKIYRACGAALLALELALAAAVTQMVLSGNPSAHGEIAAITSAAYAFYKLIFAIRNIFKAKRYSDPLVQCFRNINLTDATVSLLALQTTLVTVFSDGETGSMRALNAVVGFAVCAFTIAMGAWMIIRADAKLKRRQAAEGAQSRAGQDGADEQTGMPTVQSADASGTQTETGLPTNQSTGTNGTQTERERIAVEGSLRAEQATNAGVGAEQEPAKRNAAESGREEGTEENGDE